MRYLDFPYFFFFDFCFQIIIWEFFFNSFQNQSWHQIVIFSWVLAKNFFCSVDRFFLKMDLEDFAKETDLKISVFCRKSENGVFWQECQGFCLAARIFQPLKFYWAFEDSGFIFTFFYNEVEEWNHISCNKGSNRIYGIFQGYSWGCGCDLIKNKIGKDLVKH